MPGIQRDQTRHYIYPIGDDQAEQDDAIRRAPSFGRLQNAEEAADEKVDHEHREEDGCRLVFPFRPALALARLVSTYLMRPLTRLVCCPSRR